MADNRLNSSKSLYNYNLCRFFLVSGISPKDLLRILFAWSLLDLVQANENKEEQAIAMIGVGALIFVAVVVGAIWKCAKSGLSCNGCIDCKSGSATIDRPRTRHPISVLTDLERDIGQNGSIEFCWGSSSTPFQYYSPYPYTPDPHTPYEITPCEEDNPQSLGAITG